MRHISHASLDSIPPARHKRPAATAADAGHQGLLRGGS